MLIPFPFAYLFGSVCVDTVARLTNTPRWYPTARHMRVLGVGAAVVAAVPGIIDYVFSVPPKSSAGQRATLHGLANLSAVALFAALARSRTHDTRPGNWEIAAQVGGAALMGVAGWLGGTLVYRNQIGVDHRYADAGHWEERRLPAAASTAPVDVGAAADLEVNQMVLLHLGDRRLVLGRTEEGYVAFDDRCTHKGGPLSDGTLACGTVQCPWHGSQFDVHTGTVTHGPAGAPIRAHTVETRDGRLWLQVRE